MALESYEDKIWMKHADEDKNGYALFYNYFLPHKDPSNRTMMATYKRYLKEAKGATDAYIATVTSVPIRFTNYSKGLDKTGAIQVVPATWEERATAYWFWILESEMNETLERRKGIVEGEFANGILMLDMWNLLYTHFVRFVNSELATAKGKKEHYDTSTLVRKFRDMLNSREELAKFLRRAVGLPDTVKEDALAKQIADKKIEIEWTLPEGTKYEKTEEDELLAAMSDEDFEKLVEKLSSK